MSNEITALIAAIKENDLQTRQEIKSMNESIKIMADQFGEYWKHKAVYDEDKKHHAKFKKEVTDHLKEARPLLEYVREQKTVFSRIKTAFFIAIMFGILTLLGMSLR